jgi:hypothetical protein
MDECARLGLSYGTHNCPGWSSSGAPYVQVEDSMQKLVWTETKVSGATTGAATATIALKLDQPGVDPRWNYYRDIAVLAVPDHAEVPLESVVNLTANMNAAGELQWDAPAGDWLILRFGHTTTGMTNANTAPASGVGLECDKFSRTAVAKYWSGYPAMLLDIAGKNAGTTFTRMEIDSYEAGPQDWTPAMFEEFKTRRGYDLLPWLPALAGKTIGGKKLTKRFKRDWKQTIADLFADNYYLFMDELARRTPGMQLLVQPYGGPIQTPAVSGGQSLLSCEFWAPPEPFGGDNVRRTTSAAHTWGKRTVLAEAYTCWPLSAWSDDPYALKAVGDKQFAAGVNLMMLHAGASNPWLSVKPGMSMGKWGTQFVAGQTWWEHGGPEWMSYITRCQFLLQQGIPVRDVCFLVGENTKAPTPSGYSSDMCGERAFLARMSVSEDGRLVMPDGLGYRVLALQESDSITLPVARKLRQLVQDGAIVVGPKPLHASGLEGYPASDAEIEKIARELWGDCDGRTVTEHNFGKGKVIWGKPLEDVLTEIQLQPDLQLNDATDIRWTHRRDNQRDTTATTTADADIYFVSNQNNHSRTITASFRVVGRVPELWHADTGEIEDAPHWRKNGTRTDVTLDLDPSGSVFVVFRRAATDDGPGLQKPPAPAPQVLEIKGPWELRFPAGWGAPEKITLGQLASWTENENAGVKYFSGSATYVKDIEVPARMIAQMPATFSGADCAVTLNLGLVKNIAEVFVNGERCGGVLWKPPFRADISRALKPGKNRLEICVTNLWPNRMIGDELEPDDAEWGEPFVYPYAPGKPVIGRQLAKVPQWLTDGKPRPSKSRHTFVSWKFFTKDSPLLPSGLLGPVTLESTPATAATAVRIATDTRAVDAATMQRVYDEVKTPHKYGIVIKGENADELVDCVSLFRSGGRGGHWYMMYVASVKNLGYQTYLARSDDLLHWEKLGKILSFTKPGDWDAWQADGGVALCDYTWGGSAELEKHDGKYWLSYIGGARQGYEPDPLSIGIAWTDDPTVPKEWNRLRENPVLSPHQPDARAFEKVTLYKS